MSVGKRPATLESRFTRLERENAALRARVAELEAELAALRGEASKTSRNSSKPPSSDSPDQRKARSKPASSGRKPGGQPGHEGSQRALLLMRTKVPMIAIALCWAGCCGQLQAAARAHAESTRTVAQTLAREADGIHCEALADAAPRDECSAAVESIRLQATALNQGADVLEGAAR